MDKIWDRRSLAVVAGMKKPNDHADRQKSNDKKKLSKRACTGKAIKPLEY